MAGEREHLNSVGTYTHDVDLFRVYTIFLVEPNESVYAYSNDVRMARG